MPLTVSQVNGQYVVTGVTQDPSVTSPLGRVYFQVGSHLVGFDDNFTEPVIVRAYYDPLPDLARLPALRRRIQYLGYVQFMRLSFRGTPIPPDVYGGRLADRQPYAYGSDLRFVDFMGPSDASLRTISTPFYPYNAQLVNVFSENSEFFGHPLENGSLWAPGDPGTAQSLVASLFGEVALGFVTPATVAKFLTADNVILILTPSFTDLAENEPYRIALNFLETTALPSAPGAGPPLAGLDESQLSAQVIGDYVLLTLPDPENLGDTLVISTVPRNGGGTNIVVNLITDYDMEGMEADAARAALWRIREYQLEQQLADTDDMDLAPPPGRGRRGLLTPPFLFSPDESALELRYWTLAVAIRSNGTRGRLSRTLVSGFTWAAMFQFDEDTGAMTFAAVRQPKPCARFALDDGLGAFSQAASSDLAASQSIDTSNFTQAAMRRDNFAAGTKLQFVDDAGTALT